MNKYYITEEQLGLIMNYSFSLEHKANLINRLSENSLSKIRLGFELGKVHLNLNEINLNLNDLTDNIMNNQQLTEI